MAAWAHLLPMWRWWRPESEDGVSRFCPPAQIVHTRPFCLFLDELNACTQEVQKAFYSLIHEQRIGEYHLPKARSSSGPAIGLRIPPSSDP